MAITFWDGAPAGNPEPVDVDWKAWAGSFDPPAAHVCLWTGPEINGFPTILRVGGVMVHPADTVLGLRAFDDVHEGLMGKKLATAGVPYAIFDIEKIIRMMLHQSGLAMEILASPFVVFARRDDDEEPLDVRKIVRGAATREVVCHYGDVSRGGAMRLGGPEGVDATVADVLDLFRNLLTGRALVEDGLYCPHLPTLLAKYASDDLRRALEDLLARDAMDDVLQPELRRDLGAAAQTIHGVLQPENAHHLPERPADYDGLNDWLVELRQTGQAPRTG